MAFPMGKGEQSARSQEEDQMLLKSNRKASEIIAGVLGVTSEAVFDGRLRNRAVDSIPIYVVTGVHYCAPSAKRSPPTGFRWKRIGSENGRDIFQGTPNTVPADLKTLDRNADF
jgi:hypothetical protein